MIRRLLTFSPGRLALAKGPSGAMYRLRDGGGTLERSLLVFFSPLAEAEDRYDLTPTIRIAEFPQHVGSVRGPLRYAAFARAVARFVRGARDLVREERVEAIVALDPHLLGLTAYLLARRFRLPWAIEVVQDYDNSGRQAQRVAFKPFLFPAVERAVERFVLRRAPLVMSYFPHYGDWAIAQGTPAERVVFAGTVVDDCHYREWPEVRVERPALIPDAEKRTWLLYVGRLHPVKFTQDLPGILQSALEAGVDAHLVVIGEGVQRPWLERELVGRGLTGRVTMVPMQSQESLARWYRMADVVIYTHGGSTLVEGALAGTPVVAYRHDWHPDLVGDDERGLLVPFRDTRAFGEAIAAAVADPGAAQARAGRAREFAQRRFSYDGYAERQREILRRLASVAA
ncbi:MAG: glycosyltransferase [Candidatus Rokubacteria bacterium]|nr:glycosyltransferase [Candidatus Rokubacteria bacterium]